MVVLRHVGISALLTQSKNIYRVLYYRVFIETENRLKKPLVALYDMPGSGNSGPILSPGIKVWPWAVWQQLLSYIPNHTELHLSLSCEVMSQPCAFQVLSRMCLGPNGSMKWGHCHKVFFCCFILIFLLIYIVL